MDIIKNIEVKKVLSLKEEVTYSSKQVVRKNLVENEKVSLTLLAFDKDEEISTPSSDGEAIIYCLEGKCLVRVCEDEVELELGETIVLPKGKPHAVYAKEQFKMLLIEFF